MIVLLDILKVSVAQFELEQLLEVLPNPYIWIGVFVSILLTDFLGYLFAKKKVQPADDPIRAARNALYLAGFVIALNAFGVAFLIAWQWPDAGIDLTFAIVLSVLVLLVNWLLAFILFLLDPARSG